MKSSIGKRKKVYGAYSGSAKCCKGSDKCGEHNNRCEDCGHNDCIDSEKCDWIDGNGNAEWSPQGRRGVCKPKGRQCGVANHGEEFVIGGREATAHKYPWQALLFNIWEKEPLCGASIISSRLILTAAHCTRPFSNMDMLQVMVGVHDWTKGEGDIYDIRKKREHMKYNRQTMEYDFSILELSYEIKFRREVQMVCLPPPDMRDLFENVDVIVAGWGAKDIKSINTKSETLQEVVLKTIPNNVCAAGEYKKEGYPKISPHMLCAGTGTNSSCKGDSGGPVTVELHGYHYQIGVVSWGIKGCVMEGAPSVFARVTSLLDSLNNTKIGSSPEDLNNFMNWNQ